MKETHMKIKLKQDVSGISHSNLTWYLYAYVMAYKPHSPQRLVSVKPSKHDIGWWLEIIRLPDILLPKKPQLIPVTNRKQHNVQCRQIMNIGEDRNAGRYYIIKR